MRRSVVAVFLLLSASAAVADDSIVRLSGWAEIPSTFRQPGPTSGQFTSAGNGVTPPYVNGQPIPGFSGMLPARAGDFIGLPDNGFGAQGNSADFVLGYYVVNPEFKTDGDGTTSRGPVLVKTFTPFRDPDGLVDASFITDGPVYDRTTYYSSSAIPVDPAIKANKWLTGADFDVESIAMMNDGTFWVGEEFGPYLLHFAADGTLLSEPVRHPLLLAPQNPRNASLGGPNLPSSRGFEAMARNADGTKLYVTTEASIDTEPDKTMLVVFEFDTQTEQYTGRRWKYAKDSSDFITGGSNNETNIFVTGDMTHIAGNRYIIIERDDFQGPPNGPNPPFQKKLYLFDLNVTDTNGVLKKRLIVDLLDIDDPEDIGGPLVAIPDDKFNFPLQSVEVVTPVDQWTLLVGLDNNYPGGNGRVPGTPDGTEMILLHSKLPLWALSVEEGEIAHPSIADLLAAIDALDTSAGTKNHLRTWVLNAQNYLGLGKYTIARARLAETISAVVGFANRSSGDPHGIAQKEADALILLAGGVLVGLPTEPGGAPAPPSAPSHTISGLLAEIPTLTTSAGTKAYLESLLNSAQNALTLGNDKLAEQRLADFIEKVVGHSHRKSSDPHGLPLTQANGLVLGGAKAIGGIN